ncbi:hypothetical protein LOTGIDRAFT_158861 [Lottia gigantea]|uniref:Fucolectin tachylectin-4 pentraxin-1 domain-containing protein n=1 Tax=Lottia gigantea TaxID=225164 RepID=V4CAR2_LOTGI|nr:hypothetical protein LOTGIDRAFT_158861 [Lottia gigantea]ESO98904.1 hypothetical protein LOTGIDRAFT_158861 [Lottia gigantea]
MGNALTPRRKGNSLLEGKENLRGSRNSKVDVGVNTFFLEDTFIKNIALNKPSNISSTYYGIPCSCCAVDGILTSQINTKNSKLEWWCVDLEQVFNLYYIEIYNAYSQYPSVMERFNGFQLRFSNTGQCDYETFHEARLCYKDNIQYAQKTYKITSCNYQSVFSSRFIFLFKLNGNEHQYPVTSLAIPGFEIYFSRSFVTFVNLITGRVLSLVNCYHCMTLAFLYFQCES